jgi:hypothetical protein
VLWLLACPLTASLHGAAESRRETWDGEVDEYDNAEDVGYIRKDITDQHQFIKTELEVVDEEAEQLYAQQQTSTARSASTGSSPSLESFEVGNSSAQEAADGSSPFSAEDVQAQMAGQVEENWDEGPRDIKLVDPVVTDPSPSCHGDSPRRLSRVESLSNSFIDDNESADGLASTRQSDAGSNFGGDPEVSDYIPAVAGLDTAAPQQQEVQQEQEQQHAQQDMQQQAAQQPAQQTPDKAPASSEAARSQHSNASSSEVVADIINAADKQEQTPPSIKVASATEG